MEYIDVQNAVVINRDVVEEMMAEEFCFSEKCFISKQRDHAFDSLGKLRMMYWMIGKKPLEDPRFLSFARMMEYAFKIDILPKDEEKD
ncbi:hypothetical protein [Peribacillus sp. Hz7]|uniref:hypothetical protein n=1 Tax=Peribacillus sp. Hz7 TaxID=3344873 RepID=UPI0035CC9DAC